MSEGKSREKGADVDACERSRDLLPFSSFLVLPRCLGSLTPFLAARGRNQLDSRQPHSEQDLEGTCRSPRPSPFPGRSFLPLGALAYFRACRVRACSTPSSPRSKARTLPRNSPGANERPLRCRHYAIGRPPLPRETQGPSPNRASLGSTSKRLLEGRILTRLFKLSQTLREILRKKPNFVSLAPRLGSLGASRLRHRLENVTGGLPSVLFLAFLAPVYPPWGIPEPRVGSGLRPPSSSSEGCKQASRRGQAERSWR